MGHLDEKLACVTRIIDGKRKNCVTYNNFIYTTLCDMPVDGRPEPNLQGFEKIPRGWTIAPNLPDCVTIARDHKWSTHLLHLNGGIAVMPKESREPYMINFRESADGVKPNHDGCRILLRRPV